jgi:radical SAM superfamily enzyme YgiQ (UPF0313 family)
MKVALIAISGTPLRDQRAVEVVTSSSSLLARLKAVASLPSLALLTLAAVIAEDAEVSYHQCPNVDTWTAPDEKFDLVAISSYSAQIDEAYELANRFKAEGVPVVLGGPHVSVLPEEALALGHTACIGEAEVSWKQIIEDAKNDRLKRVYGSLDHVCDLTKSPRPAFELLDPKSFNRIPIQTSRGCPHRCEFCAASVLLSPTYRQKTIAQVLNEIDFVISRWRHPFIEFVDDNALSDRTYWKGLLKELGERKVRWFAECDISIGQDAELLRCMAQSGCREVLIGLESPTAGTLSGMELKSDWKHRMQGTYLDSIKRIQGHGIRVIGCFMVGLDTQVSESLDGILDFVEESGVFDVQLTLQTAFPGTPLHKRLEGAGRLDTGSDWRKCTLFDLNIVPENADSEELNQRFYSLLRTLHSDNQSRQRRQKFNSTLRKNRTEMI